MSKTSDKWLLAFLPALLLLLGYFFFTWRPRSREVNDLRRSVAAQGSISSKQAQLDLAKAASLELEEKVNVKKKANAEEFDGFDRNLAMQHVSQLCNSNGLSLNATKMEAANRLPAPLQEAVAGIVKGGHSTQPQVWRLELTGSYTGVLKLLMGLEKTKPLIVPLSLSMTADKNERKPSSWVLTLWL